MTTTSDAVVGITLNVAVAGTGEAAFVVAADGVGGTAVAVMSSIRTVAVGVAEGNGVVMGVVVKVAGGAVAKAVAAGTAVAVASGEGCVVVGGSVAGMFVAGTAVGGGVSVAGKGVGLGKAVGVRVGIVPTWAMAGKRGCQTAVAHKPSKKQTIQNGFQLIPFITSSAMTP